MTTRNGSRCRIDTLTAAFAGYPPISGGLLRPHNVESLRWLADIAEHRDVVCRPRFDG
ncbi:MAG: hypothetical protein ACRDTA_14755 [Pseudonocardiaceae bacterium]